MTARHVIAGVLLAGGVGVAVVCSVGVLLARTLWDRLHAAAPASVASAALVAAAIVVNEGFSAGGVKAILVCVALSAAGPVLAHATGRAARVRAVKRWQLSDQERDRPEGT